MDGSFNRRGCLVIMMSLIVEVVVVMVEVEVKGRGREAREVNAGFDTVFAYCAPKAKLAGYWTVEC